MMQRGMNQGNRANPHDRSARRAPRAWWSLPWAAAILVWQVWMGGAAPAADIRTIYGQNINAQVVGLKDGKLLFEETLQPIKRNEQGIPEAARQIIPKNAKWRYLADGNVEKGWNTLEFADKLWKEGQAGFGYGDEGLKTLFHDMRGNYKVVCFRHVFQLQKVEDIRELGLLINYDDAFVAYLNGKEVARAGVTGAGADLEVALHDAVGAEYFPLKDFEKLLKPGANVLSIEGHNQNRKSSDFVMDMQLLAASASSRPDKPRELSLDEVDRVVYASAAGSATGGGVSAGASNGMLIIDNDGAHTMREKQGSIRLRKGKHPIRVSYFQMDAQSYLDVYYSGPDITKRTIPYTAYWLDPKSAPTAQSATDAQGFRPADDPQGLEKGLKLEYYENKEWKLDKLPEFSKLKPTSSKVARRLNLAYKPTGQVNHFALRFTGYIEVPEDGEYTFYIISDDGSKLEIGPLPEQSAKPVSPAAAATINGRILTHEGEEFSGRIDSWSADSVQITLALGGAKVKIPATRIWKLWIGTTRQADESRALQTEGEGPHTIYMMRENQMYALGGRLKGFDGGMALLEYKGEDRQIKAERLVGVALSKDAAGATGANLMQVLVMRDGQRINGTLTSAGATDWVIKPEWGPEIKVPLESIARLECRNGRQVYLSDLRPVKVEEVPFLDRVIHWRADKSALGGLLQSATRHDKGISMHSRSVLEFAVDGQFEEFRSLLGMARPEGRMGNVAVRVWGDDKVLYELAELKGTAEKDVEVNVKVAGVKRLKLEVDFGAGQDVADHVVWGAARLLRGGQAK